MWHPKDFCASRDASVFLCDVLMMSCSMWNSKFVAKLNRSYRSKTHASVLAYLHLEPALWRLCFCRLSLGTCHSQSDSNWLESFRRFKFWCQIQFANMSSINRLLGILVTVFFLAQVRTTATPRYSFSQIENLILSLPKWLFFFAVDSSNTEFVRNMFAGIRHYW